MNFTALSIAFSQSLLPGPSCNVCNIYKCFLFSVALNSMGLIAYMYTYSKCNIPR